MRNQQSGKTLFPFLIILLAAICVYLYLPNTATATQTRSAKPVTVKAITTQLHTQSIDIQALGTSRANQEIIIRSAQSDYVASVFFDDGDQVEKNQILVELNHAEEAARVEELTINLKEEKRQLERLNKLAKTQSTAKSLLEEQRSRFEATQVQLAAAKIRLSEMTITAPFSGRLGQRMISAGAYINSNTDITTLDDISVIKVDFNVPEKYLAQLTEGMTVNATSPAYPSITFTGQLSNISSRINATTRSIPVTASFSNENKKLRAGMLMYASLQLSELNALIIPEKSIIPIEDQHFVYVIEEGKAVKTAVVIEQRIHGNVAIKSGLKAGQQVITEGIIKIRPGRDVVVKGGSL